MSVIIHYDKSSANASTEIKKKFESNDESSKIAGMKLAICLALNGDPLPGILMQIIRFVLTTKNHTLQKLLLVYFEIIEKTDEQGKLRPELILVCNQLRNFLNHPNEYVRGSTLRFLTKIRELELLEPLVPSVRECLAHRHSYVRRNAVLAIYSIYKVHTDRLLPDAPDLIFDFLHSEADASCKRNALVFLINCAPDKAAAYLSEALETVGSLPDLMQFTIVELIRKLVRQNPALRSKYVRAVYSLLKAGSSAVRFEAAHTLVLMSSAPSAVKAAASTYIELLVTVSDNNVKLIVLDRLTDLKKRHQKTMSDLLLDVLRALSAPSIDIRRKTLALAMELVTPKNIPEVIQVLKKEIGRTQEKGPEKQEEYRQMLIQSIHSCALRFPDVAQQVVHVLMDFLGDSTVGSAVDVIMFVREVVESFPDLRKSIVAKLIDILDSIRSSKVFRAALWILSEYSEDPAEVRAALRALKECMGEAPFVEAEEESEDEAPTDEPVGPVAATAQRKAKSGPKLNPDGTYASQSALMAEYSAAKAKETEVPNLRALLLAGDFFLGSVVAATLVKLTLVFASQCENADELNHCRAESILYMVSILRLGRSSTPPHPIDRDSAERIGHCARALMAGDDQAALVIWRSATKSAFKFMLAEQQRQTNELAAEEAAAAAARAGGTSAAGVQPDVCIRVKQLRRGRAVDGVEEDGNDDETDLSRATGVSDDASLAAESKLNRVVQLTGFSDPIFAEAFVTVHQYDIVLDITLINQTGDTLQNVSLELATLGDLKLVERPQILTIGPMDKRSLRAAIKVSSTETGIIFGNLVYDIAGVASEADRNCVVFNEIHLDVLEYLRPGTVSDVRFRQMWSEFEWENKVAVNTPCTDVEAFLAHLVKSTNMRCLTPTTALSGVCGFISANLYARSIFGEDALANVSIELGPEGRILGFVRIRSKGQGLALSCGDMVTVACKKIVA